MFRSTLKLPVFLNCLSDQERREFESESHEMKMRKGQLLFTERGSPLGCYFMLEGKVKLFKTGVLGKEQIFQICGKEDGFGFHPILNQSKYPDSAELLEDSRVLFLPTANMQSFIAQNHQLCQELLKCLATEFARFIGQETMLSQKSVSERVATVLFYLSNVYNEQSPAIIPLSRSDLSDLCGTVKETLVRVLQQLKQEGVIDTIDNKGTIRILDLNGLKRRGEIIDGDYQ